MHAFAQAWWFAIFLGWWAAFGLFSIVKKVNWLFVPAIVTALALLGTAFNLTALHAYRHGDSYSLECHDANGYDEDICIEDWGSILGAEVTDTDGSINYVQSGINMLQGMIVWQQGVALFLAICFAFACLIVLPLYPFLREPKKTARERDIIKL